MSNSNFEQLAEKDLISVLDLLDVEDLIRTCSSNKKISTLCNSSPNLRNKIERYKVIKRKIVNLSQEKKSILLKNYASDGDNFLLELDFLLKNGADIHYHKDQPLFNAVNKGNYNTIQFLLDKGATITRSIFSEAIYKGRKNIVELLLINEANPNMTIAFTGVGWDNRDNVNSNKTVLEETIIISQDDPVELIESGHSDLARAIRRGEFPDIIKLLLEYGANPKLINDEVTDPKLKQIFQQYSVNFEISNT